MEFESKILLREKGFKRKSGRRKVKFLLYAACSGVLLHRTITSNRSLSDLIPEKDEVMLIWNIFGYYNPLGYRYFYFTWKSFHFKQNASSAEPIFILGVEKLRWWHLVYMYFKMIWVFLLSLFYEFVNLKMPLLMVQHKEWMKKNLAKKTFNKL